MTKKSDLKFDSIITPPSLSQVKKKPEVEFLHKQALLIEEIRPSLHLQKPVATKKTISFWQTPRSLISRIGQCTHAIFRFSSVEWAPSLSSRAISTIALPSLERKRKIYIEEILDPNKSDDKDSISSVTEGAYSSPFTSPTASKTASPTPSTEKKLSDSPPVSLDDLTFYPINEYPELDPSFINQIEEKIELCKQSHDEIHKFRKILLQRQNKDVKLEKHGYKDTIHKRPIFGYSVKKTNAIEKFIEKIDKIDSSLQQKIGKTPEKIKLEVQVKTLKQLLVLEEKLNRNLTLVNAKSLYKEFKLTPGEFGHSKWEAVCHHFEIAEDTDLENEWLALKEKTQEEIKNLSLMVKKNKKLSW